MSFMVRTYRPLLAFAVVAIGVATLHAAAEAPTHQIYQGRVVPLDVDGKRVAVRFATAAPESLRAAAVAFAGAVGLEKRLGDPDWRILELSHAGDPRALQTLRAHEAVAFTAPVFRGADDDEWTTVTPRILLRLRADLAPGGDALLARLAPDLQVLQRNFGNRSGAYVLRMQTTDGLEVLERANALALDPRVEWAEPDWLMSALALLTPNDPLFTEQWAYRSVGHFVAAPGLDIDLDQAWDVTTGSASIKVVLLEDGVQQDHPDLNLLPGADFIGGGTDGGPVSSCDHHGTQVAGMISAILGNSLGTVGVAPDSPSLSARVVSATGILSCPGTTSASAVVDALAWGQAQGARVSNTSWHFSSAAQTQAVEDAYADTRANGMVHFAAVGRSASVAYPARLPTVIAVNGVDPLGGSYGRDGPQVSVSAPAFYIQTTDRTGADGFSRGGDYGETGGTSMASAIAAGVAALMLSVDPSLTADEIESRLQCTARDLGIPGPDEEFGHGMVNAWRAVTYDAAVDLDADGVVDACDNCIDLPNADQADGDLDGIGDPCDLCPVDIHDDLDGDGHCDSLDNCPLIANPLQEDGNETGEGDACECVSWRLRVPGPSSFDTFGIDVASPGDLNGDGFDDLLPGHTNYDNAFALSGLDGSVLYEYVGDENGTLGVSVDFIGDVNGDGYDDALLGDGGHDRLHIFHGGPGPFPQAIDALAADLVISGTPGRNVVGLNDVTGDGIPDMADGHDQFDDLYVFDGTGSVHWELHPFADLGSDVARAGDLNGDGMDEILVGATGAGIGGEVYVYEAKDGNLLYTLGAEEADDSFGASIAGVGDVDGDGVPDIMVGAYRNRSVANSAGRAYLFSGADGAPLITFSGEHYDDVFGTAVGGVTDFDGDGVPDLLVGASGASAPGHFKGGRVYLYSGQTGALIRTFDGEGSLGTALAGGFDSDNDGLDDILIGASHAGFNGTSSGAIYVYEVGDPDADGLLSACDSCPSSFNPGQEDLDADSAGDPCDNCPSLANSDQLDSDSDELGDACDICPFDATNDVDGDSVCNDVDSCDLDYNPQQLDADADGVGDVCDTCPQLGGMADDDGDGVPDDCDCEPADPNDRPVDPVRSVMSNRSGAATAEFGWPAVEAADGYSVTRGDLSGIAAGDLGSCLAEGLISPAFSDSTPPAPGQGYGYIVQAHSFDCGLGPLGHSSAEIARLNSNPEACVGATVSDAYPDGESSVDGTTIGTFADLAASDDLRERLTEELTGGGPNAYSLLEHRWTFQVTPGSRIELHVEGRRYSSLDSDDFAFEYSTGGSNWNPIGPLDLPFDADGGIDLVVLLPGSLSGQITLRVVDTDRSSGNQELDTLELDEIFIRSVP